MQQQLMKMAATGNLFRVNITGSKLWDIYLSSFKDDPIFRDPESSTHNCNHCNNFMRRYGNIVAFDADYNMMTLFDFVPEESEFLPVVKALHKALNKATIENVFFETWAELNSLPYESLKKDQETYALGVASNVKRYTKEEAEKFGVVKPDEIRTFHHLSLQLPKEFVLITRDSIDAIMAKHRDNKNVFMRGMMEIPVDTLELVRDLINQGSLLDGAAHLRTLEAMMPLKKEFDELPSAHRDMWCWLVSHNLPMAKFRNTLIGVLCSELAEGMELNKACENWNKRVDPVNYKKATAPITKRQIKEAQIFVEENGYESAFSRRPATIDDIKADEILHMNSEGGAKDEGVKLFDSVKPTKSTRHKRSEFEGVEEVGIEKFMKDILPTCTSVEAFLTNMQEGNMVTLTTAVAEDSKQIFKWDNNYSWTYNGNLAGKSMIKEAVKLAGGKIDGILNFRLAWNDRDGRDRSDLDAWAQEPGKARIGYSTNYRASRKHRSPCSGQLDVDNTDPGNKMGVENITWIDHSKMKNGVYKVWVNQYSARGSQGFKAEIEFDGQTYSYVYDKAVRGNVQVAEITYKNGEFTIEHKLPCTEGPGVTKEIYGLESNHFHKVNLICLSPNHWGENEVGNKHYFFMLEKAQSKKKIRSFHNENLKSSLNTHRKVMEVLANTTMVESAPQELSGLGFNATVRDEVILRLKGSHKRVVKVKF